MSLIPCTDHCVYQQDGYCSLSRAVSCAAPGSAVSCVNYVPRSKDRTDRLANVVHGNELQPFRDN